MGVFDAKSLEQNLGFSIRLVVVVLVRVIEQIGRLENIDPFGTEFETRREVELIEECRVLIVIPVTIGIFMNGDFVFAGIIIRMPRR